MNDALHNQSSTVLSKLPIGVYRLDADDNILYVNNAWLDLHGYKAFEEWRGKISTSFIPALRKRR